MDVIRRSDGEPDMTRMLSGNPQDLTITAAPKLRRLGRLDQRHQHGVVGPWGISFHHEPDADRETGSGGDRGHVREEIRNGNISAAAADTAAHAVEDVQLNLTDADLKAVYAYRKTIRRSGTKVPSPMPAGK